jgi:hypothetical protein
MEIFLVVFDDRSKSLGERLYPELEEYIDRNYVERKRMEEYGFFGRASAAPMMAAMAMEAMPEESKSKETGSSAFGPIFRKGRKKSEPMECYADEEADEAAVFEAEHESKLEERMTHISDTFSQYLMYLIQDKKMENAEVYKRAIVDKKIFSKIKNNKDYHPQKLTALCLCVGAKLNLDESKDLLARAGYALSPCDKTDIIFSYFIENGIYDMIELDIQLEEHGLPCIIS